MNGTTTIATIFLPLTFVVGFFGQNFAWLIRHTNSLGEFVGFGVGGLLVPSLVLLAVFRRAHYI